MLERLERELERKKLELDRDSNVTWMPHSKTLSGEVKGSTKLSELTKKDIYRITCGLRIAMNCIPNSHMGMGEV